MDQFMPAIPLDRARILVVGPGDAAENKLRLFRQSPCTLIWRPLDRTAPSPRDLKPGTQILTGQHVPLHAFRGVTLAFIAVEEGRLAARLARRARFWGALVNVVDRPELSDFYTPALLDRGAVTVALSTGGAAPILVRDIRAALEQVIPAGIGLLASSARDLRDTVREVLADVNDRRRFWEAALRGAAAGHADRGDAAGTRRALMATLDQFRTGQRPDGVVYLVGAGPGDPELLTVKAARLIRDADVIVHDRLVAPEILDRARRDALRIDVGKTRGSHPTPQSRICEILVEHARLGRRVVRLKGGDSYIFGRGGEEVDAVQAAGISVEVVPGISAALACAASAQVPLTHRDQAQAVTFLTGQPKLNGQAPDYRALSAANHTLVIYMGVATAAVTARNLIAAGRDPSTPVALVENGSLPSERIVTGELSALASLIERENVTGPTAIIVGEVARNARARSAPLRSLALDAKRSAA